MKADEARELGKWKCPSCGNPIDGINNDPGIPWNLLLNGHTVKCSNQTCGKPIPMTYLGQDETTGVHMFEPNR